MIRLLSLSGRLLKIFKYIYYYNCAYLLHITYRNCAISMPAADKRASFPLLPQPYLRRTRPQGSRYGAAFPIRVTFISDHGTRTAGTIIGTCWGRKWGRRAKMNRIKGMRKGAAYQHLGLGAWASSRSWSVAGRRLAFVSHLDAEPLHPPTRIESRGLLLAG